MVCFQHGVFNLLTAPVGLWLRKLIWDFTFENSDWDHRRTAVCTCTSTCACIEYTEYPVQSVVWFKQWAFGTNEGVRLSCTDQRGNWHDLQCVAHTGTLHGCRWAHMFNLHLCVCIYILHGFVCVSVCVCINDLRPLAWATLSLHWAVKCLQSSVMVAATLLCVWNLRCDMHVIYKSNLSR